MQIVVHSLVHPDFTPSGRYVGRGIIIIDPVVAQNGNFQTVLHEFGHGVVGYAHHVRARNCIMDLGQSFGKAGGWWCEEDMQTLENLKNGKKLERRIA